MPRYFEVVKNEHRTSDGEIILPVRADKGSAGYDFYSPVNVIIPPNEHRLIFTDVKSCMNEDDVLMLCVRSSMGKIPVMLSNNLGIIDSNYYNNQSNDGNIGFRLLNLSDENYIIHKGDRIGQGVFTKYFITDDDKADGERLGGFGSTGK